MSDAEYILKLIIRARDEFAAVFAKARAEIAGLRTSVRDASGDFDGLNKRITSLSLRLNTVTKKIEEARGGLRELAKGTAADFDKLGKSVDNVTDSITKNSKAARAAVGASKDAEAEFERLTTVHEKLNNEYRAGARSQTEYLTALKRLQSEANSVARKFDLGSGVSDVFTQIGIDAKQSADEVIAQEKRKTDAIKNAEAERDSVRKQVASQAAAAERDRARIDAQADRERTKASAQRTTQSAREVAQENRRVSARQAAAAKEAAAQHQSNRAIIDTLRSFDKFNQSLGTRTKLTASEAAGLRTYSTRLAGLRKNTDINSSGFNLLSDAIESVSARFRAATAVEREHSRVTRTVASDTNRLAHFFDGLAGKIAGSGDNVSRLDNQLRGLLVLGIFAFAQQLISVFAALGGELLAVASSAAQAASALGGIAVAGAAQAIPIIGLLAGALHRVSIINDALKKSDMVKMQQQQRSDKQNAASAKSTDQIANAQDSLTSALENSASAHDAVRDARDKLNQAIKDGRLELEDLIATEKKQELAARGAALSQADARDQLRQAIASGTTGTGLQRAELNVAQANIDASDAGRARSRAATASARAGGNINNLDSVQAARKALADAQKQAVSAERAVDRARRGLNDAGIAANKATQGYFAADSQLQYLLGNLSKAERRLFTSVQNIQATYRKNFRPITDIIINSFTRGVDTAEKLLKDKKILAAATGLATGVAGQLDRLRTAFTSQDMLRQFIRIVAQAKDNLPGLGSIAIRVGKALANIAEAAGPALHTFIGFIGDLAGRFLRLTGNKKKLEDFFNTGEKHLESWIKLGIAVVRLFFAISGQGGAAEGKKGIDDLTASLDDMTNSVNRNGDKVKKFFADARRGTDAVFSVLKAVGVELFKSFDPASVEGFAKFLNTVLVPALGSAIRFTGSFVHILTTFLSLPIIGPLAKFAFTFLLFTKVVTGLYGAMGLFNAQLGHFFRILGPIATPLTSLRNLSVSTGILGTKMKEGGRLSSLLGTGFEKMGTAGEKVAVSLTKAFKSPIGALSGMKTAIGGIISSIGDLIKKLPGLGRAGDAVKRAGDRVSTSGVTPGGKPGIATQPGGTGPTSSKYSVLPAPRNAPREPTQAEMDAETRRSRRASVARGAGTAARVGGAAALFVGAQSGGTRDFAEAADYASKTGKRMTDMLNNLAGVLSGDFGKAFKGLAQTFTNGMFGQKSRDDLQNFGRTFEENATKFSKTQNVEGLKGLAKQARELGKDFPQFADAMDAAAKHADELAKQAGVLRTQLRVLGAEAGQVRKGRLLGSDILDEKGVQDVYKRMRGLAKSVPDSVDTMRTNLRLTTKQIGQDFRVGSQSWAVAMSDNMTAGIRGISNAIDAGKITTKDGMTEIRKITSRQMRLMRDSMDDMSYQGKEALADNFRNARRAIEIQTGGWRDATHKELVEIRRLMAAELELYGLDPASARRLATNRRTKGRTDVNQFGANERTGGGGATGGVFGVLGSLGERGADAIPAWLGRGEMVLNSFHQRYIDPAVQAFYGHPLVKTFSRISGYHAGGPDSGAPQQIGVKRFAGGGMVPIAGQGGNGTPPGVEYINSSIKGLVDKLRKQYHALITDAFDPTGRKHKSPGHEVTGTAVDFVPGGGGSWDMIEALGRWAVGKGMVVGYGAGVPGSQAWPGHGRGQHIHIEFGGGGDISAGIVQAAAKLIGVRNLPGKDSRFRDIAQLGVDSVRGAANRLIQIAADNSGGGINALGAPAGGGVPAPPGVVRKWLTQALKLTNHFSPANLAALYARTQFESGGNPQAINLSDSNAAKGTPSKGLLQTIDSTFQSYRLKRLPNNIYDPVANAVAAIRYMFARYGHIMGNTGKGYAAGGQIPGPDGAPRNILAHAGEWILNKTQQSKLARIVGVVPDAIKSLIGLPAGQSSAATGTAVTASGVEDKTTASFYTSAAEKKRLDNIKKGIYELRILPLKNWEDFLTEVKRVFNAIGNIGAAWKSRVVAINKEIAALKKDGVSASEAKQIKDLRGERTDLQRNVPGARKGAGADRRLNALNAFTNEGGLLDQMDTAREKMSSKLSRELSNLAFKFNKFGKGANRNWNVIANTDKVEIANKALSNSRQALSKLMDEEGDITKALGETQRRMAQLRKGGISKKESSEYAALTATLTNLQGRYSTIRDEHFQLLQQVWEDQVAAQQAQVDAVNAKFDKLNAENDSAGRRATARGDDGGIAKVNAARRDYFTRQADELSGKIAAAAAIGNTDLVNTLTTQVQDLRDQVFESLQADVQAAFDAIGAGQDARTRVTDFRTRIADVQARMGTAVNGVFGGGADTVGAAQARESINAQQGADLKTTRDQYTQLLASQMALPENQRNLTVIKSLNDSIGELDVAVLENTATQRDLTTATRQASIDLITGRQGFQGGVFGSLGTLLQTIGTGRGDNSTVGQQLGLLGQNAKLLGQTGGGLRDKLLTGYGINIDPNLHGEAFASVLSALNFDTIETNMSEAEKTQFENLINAIIDNETATVSNTQAIDALNGVVHGPQTFSTTAWQWFRSAIFNGMGQVMPQFQVPTAYGGPALSYANNTSNVSAGSSLAGSGAANNKTVNQDIDVNYYVQGDGPSPIESANHVAWATKTANTQE